MTTSLPVEESRFPSSVGSEREGGAATLWGVGVAVLDSDIYRDMRWCANCGAFQEFLEPIEFRNGRLRCCQKCGDEYVPPFTRTIAEVA
jgi:hypothetical protein